MQSPSRLLTNVISRYTYCGDRNICRRSRRESRPAQSHSHWKYKHAQFRTDPCSSLCPLHDAHSHRRAQSASSSSRHPAAPPSSLISGAILIEPPVPDVPVATAQSNTFINMFTERTDYTLPTSTPVDITPDGSSSRTYRIGFDPLTPSTLAAGTPVDSYFMYSDPVGQPHKLFPYVGTLTFSTPDSRSDGPAVHVGLHGHDRWRSGNGLQNRLRRWPGEQRRPSQDGRDKSTISREFPDGG